VRLEANLDYLATVETWDSCDGSLPMCFPRGEFMLGGADVLLGEIGGQPFYILTRSRLYTDEEWKALQPVTHGSPG